VSAISSVRGRVYTSEPSIALYPTTGTQSDYAYSRHIANSKLRKTYGFTFETGPWAGNIADSFHPADPTLIKRDAKAGVIALMQQCICAIELIGARFFATDTEAAAHDSPCGRAAVGAGGGAGQASGRAGEERPRARARRGTRA
jgi:hypothetical protein